MKVLITNQSDQATPEFLLLFPTMQLTFPKTLKFSAFSIFFLSLYNPKNLSHKRAHDSKKKLPRAIKRAQGPYITKKMQELASISWSSYLPETVQAENIRSDCRRLKEWAARTISDTLVTGKLKPPRRNDSVYFVTESQLYKSRTTWGYLIYLVLSLWNRSTPQSQESRAPCSKSSMSSDEREPLNIDASPAGTWKKGEGDPGDGCGDSGVCWGATSISGCMLGVWGDSSPTSTPPITSSARTSIKFLSHFATNKT